MKGLQYSRTRVPTVHEYVMSTNRNTHHIPDILIYTSVRAFLLSDNISVTRGKLRVTHSQECRQVVDDSIPWSKKHRPQRHGRLC